jgi:hypothetical protein
MQFSPFRILRGCTILAGYVGDLVHRVIVNLDLRLLGVYSHLLATRVICRTI